MVSTLKLTKIQIPNSDSDVLSFNSITGIMTFHKDIQGEGTATTNLQQGLAKSWVNATGDGTTLNDSFNLTSATDTGTGNIFFNLINNTSNAHYSLTGGGQITTLSGTGVFFHNVQGGATTGYQIQHFQNAAGADPQEYTGITLHGDLT